MRTDWVEPTSLVMEITPSLRSPDPEYLQGRQNYNNLRELGYDLARNELRLPWQRNVGRTRNRSKRIITCIRSCQEKKAYSHTQHHVSTQRQKSSGLSLECDNTTDSQSRRISNVVGKIIIKEGRTRKVSHETISFKEEKRRNCRRRRILSFGFWPEKDFRLEPFQVTQRDLGLLRGKEINKEKKETKYPPFLMTKKLSQRKIQSVTHRRTACYMACLFTVKYSVVLTAHGIVSLSLFVIHDFINEHNGGRNHYSLGRTTLKNSFCTYLLLQLLTLTTS